MKGILLSLFLVLSYLHTIQGSWNLERYHRYFQKRERLANCNQETPNCDQCVAKRGCSWCGDDGIFKCSTKQRCSQAMEQSCSPNPSENDLLKTVTKETIPQLLDNFLNFNPRNVVFDSNSCSARTNCSYCTSTESCAWCEKTRTCLVHYNTSSTTKACGSDAWYKDQCLYSSKIKPCPERTSGCKECTSDSVCFWCKSTCNCSYYPHDAYVPDNCPRDSWYYKSCSRIKLILVLAPILTIIGLPILIFIVLGIVMCCMKRMGYEGLEDHDEAEEVQLDSPPKDKKPFLMNHKPAPSKVEELKKKYNLEDKP